MAAQPLDAVRFDAAVVLSQLRLRHPSAAVDRAFVRALEVARRDADNPRRRFFDADAGASRETVTGWNPDGVTATNPFVTEALWCDVFGLRDETLHALEALHDDGGYLSTHALWAVDLARERGCRAPDAKPWRDELLRAQPSTPGPTTMDVDLFAERLVVLRLSGERTLDDAPLRARQNKDGSFGTDGTPVQRFHATMMAAWALGLK